MFGGEYRHNKDSKNRVFMPAKLREELGETFVIAKDIREADLTKMAVVIGSEGRGVRKEILESADHELIIPMNPRCESLNAGIAAAICMWQMKK